MEIAELKAQIQSNTLKHFYIFTGSEWKIQKIYLDQIAKTTCKELKYVDSFTDIYSSIRAKSFIQKSYVYVVRDDKELIQNEKVQSQLDNLLKCDILIMLLTTVDKRLKFYKKYKDLICEFQPLSSGILKKYIRKEIDLSDKNCDKLMEICEYDYGRCLLEIDKIKQYTAAYYNGQPLKLGAYDKTFITLCEYRLIYQPPKDAIFDFVDAVLDKNVKSTFNLYSQCVAIGEAVMVLLSVLYSSVKAVLQVQNCTSSDVAKSTGLNQWQIIGAKKHLNVYSSSELVNLMRMCQKCQQSIVTGTIDEEFVMDYILTSIL